MRPEGNHSELQVQDAGLAAQAGEPNAATAVKQSIAELMIYHGLRDFVLYGVLQMRYWLMK